MSKRPVRYITIAGATAKSCRKINLLLKNTSYYCVVDFYRSSRELEKNEFTYLPDCVILEIRSMLSYIFLKKKIENIKELIPGVKVILYNSMVKNTSKLKKEKMLYEQIDSTYNEQQQLFYLDNVLGDRQ